MTRIFRGACCFVAASTCLNLNAGSIEILVDPAVAIFEFEGSSYEIYDDDIPRQLVDDWVGQRNPDANSIYWARPFSKIENGLLTYRGGYFDELRISRELSDMPEHFTIQIKFRRDSNHANRRADELVDFNIDPETGAIGKRVYVDSGRSHQTGISNADSVTYSLTTGEWYILELTQDHEVLEMRVWPESNARPVLPLVMDPNLMELDNFRFTGSNLDRPQVSVDWITIDWRRPESIGEIQDKALAAFEAHEVSEDFFVKMTTSLNKAWAYEEVENFDKATKEIGKYLKTIKQLHHIGAIDDVTARILTETTLEYLENYVVMPVT